MGHFPLSQEMLDRIRVLCRQMGVAVAYLFGSAARGTRGPLSDVDLALLLDSTHTPSSRFAQRLEITTHLTHLLRAPRVDVVILNDAPPLLQFRVIQQGQVLFERDPQDRVTFEARAIQRYCDTQPLRRHYGQALLTAIRTGRFYG